MPFEDTFCDREGCGHNVPDHPKDGPCQKCNCVGFFGKHEYRDPLADYYARKIIDIHVAFVNDLDTAKHMTRDFPSMASKFFHEKKTDIEKFWMELAINKPELANSVNQKIQLWNQYGKEGMRGLDIDECKIISKLSYDGANYERELMLIDIMILSFLTTRFREFIRELSILILEIEFKHKGKHKSLKHEELELKAYNISEMDIKKLLKEFEKEWNLDLMIEDNYSKFTECFYRRNVFIHNNGFPNKKYRDKTGYKGPNDKLKITKDYLLQLINVFLSYSDKIYEHFLEKECSLVNITKKGNSHHIDLTNGGGEIIPIKDK